MLGDRAEQSVYWLGYGFDSQQGQVIFFFSKTFPQLLLPINPVVTREYSPVGEVAQDTKLTTPLHLGSRLRMSGVILPNLPYAFTTCAGLPLPLFFISTHCDRVDVNFGVISGSKQRHKNYDYCNIKFLWIRWRECRRNWFQVICFMQRKISFAWN
jgi:hypothetical protein